MFGFSGSNNGFGNKPAGSTGFSFGQNNNNTNTQPSASGFGFGGSQPNSGTATTGGFGANQATNTFGSNQQSSTGGGLFGNKPALGSLGSSSTTASGTTAAGTGLFGQQTAQPQQSTIGGGLFGNKPTTTTGGLFGNSAQNNSTTSGGLFGNKVGSTGSLMGGNSTQNTSNMNAGGLFGAKPQNTTATTGGLFGSKPQGSTTNGGLFGSGTQNNNTLGGGGLFGQSQQPQTNTAPGLGNTVSTQPSFAWSKPSTGSNLQQQQQQQIQVPLQQTQAIAQQQQLSNYPQQIQEQVLKCKESWDPNTTKTKLRAFVYNKVNETEAILYTKPGHVLQEEWDQAMEKKPSPQTIPIQIYGFEGLNQRNQVQTENVAQARIILNHILEKSTQLQQKHELDTASRILKAQSRNVEIEKRILKLGTQLATLKNRGLPLGIAEEKMWSQFQTLLQRSEDPAGLGKTNELWARLAILKERAKNISSQLDSKLMVFNDDTKNQDSMSKGTGEESNDRINKIVEILTNQQRGITYLNEVLEKDAAIVKKYKNKT
ncbi:ADI_G0022920.mRNA.1.CDS.1 [Saccharomyces cerevisiae]|uniref:YGR119Cp-like protein n=2 Tax=Saccharomyces cerevisiae TaxID=4932 RepID=B5VJ65_YEAS6|nr:Nup57p [Saccharomyces cerevisiae YJM189]AJR76713.1 Nup57p [Saccharomyces cerevisiae YJM193]AJR77711.1 Nup57p [Saccharomyces cerevisiae YJM244]AJR79195.1 Nup57p [Saccharomyces cerevisiae YJM271]AJR80154.1 Nup57p [Saccharomyces cerevisiae YJM326]AJR80655.1 Nup57p [Saccharomyces cerevisiae YJM428]AJR82151.1 Nup57p [Saccharomyces cerevisiae YJM453]AJR86133.1 Nup57p [Saccharomyces cerevisiae YJM682]AJR86632.1 Nup57p [Saccharomyces cerevisiae YJM683]AJR88083.1 Nup57p [Saccharomyces cerevisiae